MTKRSGIFALMASSCAHAALDRPLRCAERRCRYHADGDDQRHAEPGSTRGSVTYTVSVTGSVGAATGSVDVSDGGAGSCSISDITMATSCAFTEPTPGSYTVTATYSGDSNYAGGTGSTSESIGPSSTAVTNNAVSAQIATGGTLIFTATVSSPVGGSPVGTFAWSGSACTPTAFSAGTATCSIANAQATTLYSETASFTDTDGLFSNSGDSDGPVSPTPAASATVLTDNSSGVSTGGTLIYTATVSGPGGTPAGTVAWSGSACTSSTTTLDASQQATCTIDDAQASIAYNATATFHDTDGNYAGSSSSDSTAAVMQAHPTVPSITNLPTSGTFGSGFNASLNTNVSNGAQSVTSSTPAVCSTSGLAVSYVGVGTCSLNAQVAAERQLLRWLWHRPELHDRACRCDHADHHEHPVARQRVLRLHGHRGHDR